MKSSTAWPVLLDPLGLCQGLLHQLGGRISWHHFMTAQTWRDREPDQKVYAEVLEAWNPCITEGHGLDRVLAAGLTVTMREWWLEIAFALPFVLFPRFLARETLDYPESRWSKPAVLMGHGSVKLIDQRLVSLKIWSSQTCAQVKKEKEGKGRRDGWGSSIYNRRVSLDKMGDADWQVPSRTSLTVVNPVKA